MNNFNQLYIRHYFESPLAINKGNGGFFSYKCVKIIGII